VDLNPLVSILPYIILITHWVLNNPNNPDGFLKTQITLKRKIKIKIKK